MADQGNRILISYNDSSKDPQNRDAAIAIQLANHLLRNGMYPERKEYSQSRISHQPPDNYDWLILVYSPDARRSPVYRAVENALDLTVKRHMRGVIAITPGPAELPPEWATIRKYDASIPPEAIKQAMSYAKLPYTKEMRKRKSPMALIASVATIITVLVIAAIFVPNLITPIRSPTMSPTPLPSPNVIVIRHNELVEDATASALLLSSAQKLYRDTVGTSPKISGFRDAEKWETNSLCVFNQNATYQAANTTTGQYVKCMATATSLKNFAYQVTLDIKGDAGGVIFRYAQPTNSFYRFSVTPGSGEGEFAVILCQIKCSGSTEDGMVITRGQIVVDPTNVTLTVIAKDSIINLYVNGKFVYQLTDKIGPPGAIGVYAAAISNPTTVTFTDPKVWQL